MLVSINGNRNLLPEIENTHVVEAQNVIGVGVREHDGIEAGQTFAQSLTPKVRRGVDDHHSPIILQ
jgi:hypothetical protein